MISIPQHLCIAVLSPNSSVVNILYIYMKASRSVMTVTINCNWVNLISVILKVNHVSNNCSSWDRYMLTVYIGGFPWWYNTVYPKKYVHGFVVLCFIVVMQSFIMNSHEVFVHIHQGCFAGTGAIVRWPQCQWSKPDGYGKISQCITTTKHSKAKTVCIFLGIYCMAKLYVYVV